MTDQEWDKLTEGLYDAIKKLCADVCGESLAERIADAYAPEIAEYAERRAGEEE